jgi:hypothetical protein
MIVKGTAGDYSVLCSGSTPFESQTTQRPSSLRFYLGFSQFLQGNSSYYLKLGPGHLFPHPD